MHVKSCKIECRPTDLKDNDFDFTLNVMIDLHCASIAQTLCFVDETFWGVALSKLWTAYRQLRCKHCTMVGKCLENLTSELLTQTVQLRAYRDITVLAANGSRLLVRGLVKRPGKARLNQLSNSTLEFHQTTYQKPYAINNWRLQFKPKKMGSSNNIKKINHPISAAFKRRIT